MVIVSVQYPNQPGSRFDERYYLDRHATLVKERWGPFGLTAAQFLRGTGAPGGGGATYAVMALLTFASQDALDKALAAHGREIMGDIPNFTDVRPVVQVNEVMG